MGAAYIPPSAEALEDDIKPLSKSEQTSGNTPPQPDLSLLHHPSKCHASFVSLERLLISPLVTVVQALCSGIGSQAECPPEHRRSQPDLRVPTPPRREQPCDGIPWSLKQPRPDFVRRDFRGLMWDLGRRLLDFVGLREGSPRREWRSIPYFFTAVVAGSLPDPPLDRAGQ